MLQCISTNAVGWIIIEMIILLIECAVLLFSINDLRSKFSTLGNYQSQADEGLVFCKLGENYVWLTKAEYERLCLTDRSE
jgi:hypothetical protein